MKKMFIIFAVVSAVASAHPDDSEANKNRLRFSLMLSKVLENMKTDEQSIQSTLEEYETQIKLAQEQREIKEAELNRWLLKSIFRQFNQPAEPVYSQEIPEPVVEQTPEQKVEVENAEQLLQESAN